jgi:hypothetical protein
VAANGSYTEESTYYHTEGGMSGSPAKAKAKPAAASKVAKEKPAKAKVTKPHASASAKKVTPKEATPAALRAEISPGTTIEIFGMQTERSKRLNGKRGIVSKTQTQTNLRKGLLTIDLHNRDGLAADEPLHKDIPSKRLRVIPSGTLQAEAAAAAAAAVAAGTAAETAARSAAAAQQREEADRIKAAAEARERADRQAEEAEVKRAVDAAAAQRCKTQARADKQEAADRRYAAKREMEAAEAATKQAADAAAAAATAAAAAAAETAAQQREEEERIKAAEVLAMYRKRLSLYLNDGVLDEKERDALDEEFADAGVTAGDLNEMMADLLAERTARLKEMAKVERAAAEAEKDAKAAAEAAAAAKYLILSDTFYPSIVVVTVGFPESQQNGKVGMVALQPEQEARDNSANGRTMVNLDCQQEPELICYENLQLITQEGNDLRNHQIAEHKKRVEAAKAVEDKAEQAARIDHALIATEITLEASAMAVGQELGTGGFAKVYKGAWAGHGPVAIKVFQGLDYLKLPAAEKQAIKAEINVGCTVRSEYLVQTFGWVQLPLHGFSIVLDVVDGGTLFDALSKPDFGGGASKPTLAARIGWLIDTAAGMKCL